VSASESSEWYVADVSEVPPELGLSSSLALRSDGHFDWRFRSTQLTLNAHGDWDRDGEMFTFDSDMEWDWGAPWYRATRVVHCVVGGEYGWRSGTGVWPAYYPDSLPPTLDVGLGSPTGVRFGAGAAFPARRRDVSPE
jgi:hypothetical protein